MINKAAELIKKYEGLRLKAYLCPAGVPTIGYGHTDNVKLGDVITKEEAEQFLEEDLKLFESRVHNIVRIKLTYNQSSALISFAYNVGITALKNSTLLQLVNNGHMKVAAEEFLKWDKATVKGKKVVLEGLSKRREEERQLFLAEN